MNTIGKWIGGAFIAAALWMGMAAPAAANVQVLCSAEVAVGTNLRTIGGTLSPVPSGTVYVLNGQGCAAILSQDVGYFVSQGFTPGAMSQSFIYNTGVLVCVLTQTCANNSGAPQIGTVPAWASIRDIIISNSTQNSIAQGIDFGANDRGVGATIIASQVSCGPNCLVSLRQQDGNSHIFSTTVFSQATAIFASAHGTGAANSGWNSANVWITVIWDYF